MPITKVRTPTGEIVKVRHLEGATDEEIIAYAKQNAGAQEPKQPKESAARMEGRNADPQVRGLLSVAQGPTFGFADELYGAAVAGGKSLADLILPKPRSTQGVPAAPTLKQNYRESRDFARGAQKQQAEDFPIASTVTQLAATAPMLAVRGLTPAKTLLGRTGQAAGVGGAQGAVAGAGGSEADDLAGLALDTVKGGVIGAGTSGAAVPVMAAVGGAGRNVAARVSNSSAADFARRKIAEALIRDARGTVAPSTGQAAARMAKLGDEARVMDAGGQNTRALLDVSAAIPGRTKQATEVAIRARQAGRGGRLISAAEENLNPSGLRLQETVDDLIARRQEAAAPLYRQLDDVVVTADDELREILASAKALGATGSAKRIATAKRQPFTVADDAETIRFTDVDRVKRGLDDRISVLMRKGKKEEAAAIIGLKNDLLEKLDEATSGAYKKARDAFAGPSALIDAAEEGRKALTLGDQDIAKIMRGLGESEKEAFRLGAYEAVRAKLGTRAGQSNVMDMWREQATQEKLRVLFGSERAYREFASRVAAESRMRGLENVGRGSQTAPRQFANEDLNVDALENAAQIAGNVASGRLGAAASNVARFAKSVTTPEAARDEIGRFLLLQGQQGRAALPQLEELIRQINTQRNALVMGSGMAGGFNPLIPR